MLRPILLLLLLLSALFSAEPTLQEMQKEQRIALIIANGDYAAAPLTAAANEGTMMRDFLRQHGFETLYYENADRRTFIKAIREFALQCKPDGVALFYYFGHALQQDGINYLVPFEAPVLDGSRVRYETIDLSNILGKLSKLPSRTAIALLDTPYGEPFGKQYRPEKPGLAPIKPQAKTSIFLAAQPGRKTAVGHFTTRFIQAVQTQGTSLKEGAKHLQESTRSWISVDPGVRFYFVLPAMLSKEMQMTPTETPARSFG